MTKLVLCACAALAVLTASCVSGPDEFENYWNGRSKDDLLDQHGPPATTSPDGQGGEVWIYKATMVVDMTFGAQVFTQKLTFYIDKAGVIYKTRRGHWSMFSR